MKVSYEDGTFFVDISCSESGERKLEGKVYCREELSDKSLEVYGNESNTVFFLFPDNCEWKDVRFVKVALSVQAYRQLLSESSYELTSDTYNFKFRIKH